MGTAWWRWFGEMERLQTMYHMLILPLSSYDAIAAAALVRAAERKKSPAILQIFPVTMRESAFWFAGNHDRPFSLSQTGEASRS